MRSIPRDLKHRGKPSELLEEMLEKDIGTASGRDWDEGNGDWGSTSPSSLSLPLHHLLKLLIPVRSSLLPPSRSLELDLVSLSN